MTCYADQPSPYPVLCPGCSQDFDSRLHTERWCGICRPDPEAPDNDKAHAKGPAYAYDTSNPDGPSDAQDAEDQRAACAFIHRDRPER